MQYLVIAYDNDNALERRMEARPAHIKATQALMKSGKIITACAMIEEEKMVGSTVITNFDTEEEFEAWLSNEPYVKGNVWNMDEIQIVMLRSCQKSRFYEVIRKVSKSVSLLCLLTCKLTH
jgi:uncharacterized protein YciI